MVLGVNPEEGDHHFSLLIIMYEDFLNCFIRQKIIYLSSTKIYFWFSKFGTCSQKAYKTKMKIFSISLIVNFLDG